MARRKIRAIRAKAKKRPRNTPLARVRAQLRKILQRNVELEQRVAELEQLVDRDTLIPELLNRRGIERAGRAILSVFKEYVGNNKRPSPGAEVAVVVVDADNLKLYNDGVGYSAGDGMLKSLGKILTDGVRGRDVVGRWGGDEFVIILQDVPFINAETLMSRISTQFEGSELPTKSHIPHGISFGIAHSDETTEWKELFAIAERRMKEQKQSRRVSR